ncbi:hypothetical protein ACIBFB_05350 [Nocardiopsis sp. NPDC050513]|uniref:hypothetical protein n=1 Tax=Nocardiopsis sp. NPDC050513 TaxID=3364338 RepID=UPI0037A32A7E
MRRQTITATEGSTILAYRAATWLMTDPSDRRPDARFPCSGLSRSEAVAPDLRRAVYTTARSVVGVDTDGTVSWRFDLGRREPPGTAWPAFSSDGSVLWLHVPVRDTADGRHGALYALRSATGEVLARAEVGPYGEQPEISTPPDPALALIESAHDGGSGVHLARLDGNALTVTEYDFDHGGGSSVADISPDGRTMAVVGPGPACAVRFRSFPDGALLSTVTPADLGYDEDALVGPLLGYDTGFLDASTAVVDLDGEPAGRLKDALLGCDCDTGYPCHTDGEFREHHAVDVRTGRVLGLLPRGSRHADAVHPLGDGTWVSVHTGPLGTTVRRRHDGPVPGRP